MASSICKVGIQRLLLKKRNTDTNINIEQEMRMAESNLIWDQEVVCRPTGVDIPLGSDCGL